MCHDLTVIYVHSVLNDPVRTFNYILIWDQILGKALSTDDVLPLRSGKTQKMIDTVNMCCVHDSFPKYHETNKGMDFGPDEGIYMTLLFSNECSSLNVNLSPAVLHNT